jgi:predicted metal-dependent hydrolase
MALLQSEIVSLPGGPARVEWRRSTRARRVSLRIDPRDGSVVVTLPMRAARHAGVALLMDHADWVAKRLAALPAAVTLAHGAEVPLHGVPHRIRHVAQARGGVWIEGAEILVAGGIEFLPRRVADFLRAEARRCLAARALEKAALADLHPKRVMVKDTRSRWGSCAPDRTLSFCWRLIMAPDFVQDYVVAHEVAHLRHMNHGPRFWALAETLTPHRLAANAWLRREAPRLLRVA